VEGPCEEAERREGGYEGIRTTGPPRSWVTDMTTGNPCLLSTRVSHAFWYITFLRRFYMYTHHLRGWTFTQLCSYIPPSIGASSCIWFRFLHPQSLPIFTPQSLSHTLTLFFPPCLLNQERYYSLNLIMISPPVLSYSHWISRL